MKVSTFQELEIDPSVWDVNNVRSSNIISNECSPNQGVGIGKHVDKSILNTLPLQKGVQQDSKYDQSMNLPKDSLPVVKNYRQKGLVIIACFADMESSQRKFLSPDMWKHRA